MRALTISISALLALAAPARADQSIGSATLIEKSVEGLAGERNMRLKAGDAVYFNELLTTGLQSRGKFVLDDRATLQMGPSSQVRLDSFVYANASASAPAVAVNVTKGVLRLMSAPNHKPYEVRTHNASIGVRGTAFAVRSTERRTDAVLYEGAIEVCLPNGGACRTLGKPCTIVAVTDAGFSQTRAVGAGDWSFDDACRPKVAPKPKRHGAVAPPPAPRKVLARLDPPHADATRPHSSRRRIVNAEPAHPRRQRRPYPIYDEPGPVDYAPVDPPVRRFPPVIFGGGGGWGGHFPQGPRGGVYGGGMGRGRF